MPPRKQPVNKMQTVRSATKILKTAEQKRQEAIRNATGSHVLREDILKKD